jgi:phage shock protein PspC (stress-responsive transcriptional regulator)
MMDKSVKINLAGTLFRIDEEAYHLLRDYLLALNNRFKNVPGGNETIEDIESRIAEIFRSQGGTAGVITRENVDAMIRIIGQPADFEINEPSGGFQPQSSYRRRLYRNPDERIISGICGGIGSYLNFDPVWVRLIFILFTFTFGIGFLLYMALWIALPIARTDAQKRELYGDYQHSQSQFNTQKNEFSNSNSENSGSNVTTRNLGNAFNEVIMALVRCFYIIFRVFAIVFGVCLVIVGFASMMAFILVLFVKNQGFLPAEIHGNFFYLPDFLTFVANPSLAPWICLLISLVVLLPLLTIIYWGIKMIFWFRSRDGVISLIALVVWVMSITALVIILVGQGLSFSETGRVTSAIVLDNPPDTLYIVADKKVSDLKYDRDFIIPHDAYSLYANTESLELSIKTYLQIETSGDKAARIEVIKQSAGTGKIEANRRAESLPYNYRFSKDTLYLDEYFTLPKDHKWCGDEIHTILWIPSGTVLWFDKVSGNLPVEYNDETVTGDMGNKYWVISSEGLKISSSVKNPK